MELQLYDELLLNITNVTVNETIQIENLNTLNIINILSKFLAQYENQTNIDIILVAISNIENVLNILFKMLNCFNLELLLVQTKVSSNQNLEKRLLKLIVDTFKVILRLKLSCNISFFTINNSKEMMKKLLNILKFNNDDISISTIRCLTNLLFNDPSNVCLFISEEINGLIILSLVLNSAIDMSNYSSLKCDLFSCVTKIFYMITCQW